MGQSRSPPSSVGDAASAGLQRPESAAEWSKLAAGPASSTGSRCDGPRSALMGAASRAPHMALAQQLSKTIGQVSSGNPKIATALVRLNPDIVRWFATPLSTSSGEDTAPPPILNDLTQPHSVLHRGMWDIS